MCDINGQMCKPQINMKEKLRYLKKKKKSLIVCACNEASIEGCSPKPPAK